jgi:hypothetical protein
MILFQEDGQAVGFSPKYITRNPPLQEKLLGLYLFAILIVLLVRAIQLTRCVWALRKKGRAAQNGWDKVWTLGKLRARSLMRLAVLTFFLCILETSLTFANDFWAVGTQKVVHTSWILVEVSEDIRAFNTGMAVCVALYICGIFFESWLDRRRLAVNTAHVPSQAPTD